jgi:predicted nuclease of predicted toxin-antitoxin system
MRFLADENFPGGAVAALRSNGYDVAWIRTLSPGISDPEVLKFAQAEDRILLTFDKDFGELAFVTELPATSGIILFRIQSPSSIVLTEKIVTAIELRNDWAGHFSTIDNNKIRMREL